MPRIDHLTIEKQLQTLHGLLFRTDRLIVQGAPSPLAVRLLSCGMTSAELTGFAIKYERLAELAGYAVPQDVLIEEFFGEIASRDIEEWLNVCRALGHFITDREQYRWAHEHFIRGDRMIVTDLSPNPAKASQVVVAAGAAYLGGYAFAEKTGSKTAKIVLRDGTSGAGKGLLPITFKPSESTRDVFIYGSEGSKGVPLMTGAIYLEVVEGEVEGMVIWG